MPRPIPEAILIPLLSLMLHHSIWCTVCFLWFVLFVVHFLPPDHNPYEGRDSCLIGSLLYSQHLAQRHKINMNEWMNFSCVCNSRHDQGLFCSTSCVSTSLTTLKEGWGFILLTTVLPELSRGSVHVFLAWMKLSEVLIWLSSPSASTYKTYPQNQTWVS